MRASGALISFSSHFISWLLSFLPSLPSHFVQQSASARCTARYARVCRHIKRSALHTILCDAHGRLKQACARAHMHVCEPLHYRNVIKIINVRWYLQCSNGEYCSFLGQYCSHPFVLAVAECHSPANWMLQCASVGPYVRQQPLKIEVNLHMHCTLIMQKLLNASSQQQQRRS